VVIEALLSSPLFAAVTVVLSSLALVAMAMVHDA
jgi:hypothetical protein